MSMETILTTLLVIFVGFAAIPGLFSNLFANRAYSYSVFLTSFGLALLVVLIIYFIANRKKHPISIVCLGVVGALWEIFVYVRRCGFGFFFPLLGHHYETIPENVYHFESALERNSPHLHPWSSWLVPLRYYLLLALAIFAAATLVIGIYNLKKRRQFSLRQVLIITFPMVCIVTISVFPKTGYSVLDWQDFILPLLLLLTLVRKREKTALPKEETPLFEKKTNT